MRRKTEFRWLIGFLLIFLTACTTQTEIDTVEPDSVETEVETEAPIEEQTLETAIVTEEMAPTATPRTVLWLDDFSDVNSGWERNRGIDGALDYGEEEEVYEMLVPVDNNLYWVMKDEDLEDVVMSVEAWQVDGPEGSLYGLMCRYDSNVINGYFFLINSLGEAAVGIFGPGFQPISGGELTAFDVIQTGLNVKNTIAASCVGESLTMSVNGEVLFDIPTTGLTGGEIGMAVATPMGAGADVYFDDLTVYQP